MQEMPRYRKASYSKLELKTLDGLKDVLDETKDLLSNHLQPSYNLDTMTSEIQDLEDHETKLSEYLEILRVDLVQHRVRPKRTMVEELKSKLLSMQSRLTGKLDLIDGLKCGDSNQEAFEKLKSRGEKTSERLDKLLHLTRTIFQVILLQEKEEELRIPDFALITSLDQSVSDGRPYLQELSIKSKCYTSEERLASMKQFEFVRKFEKTFFDNRNAFERELECEAHEKAARSLHAIASVEKQREEIDRNHRLDLLNSLNK